jgi:putative serine protease PepD
VVSGFRSIDGSDYIQFSAPISPGNSGGPVVDADGRVVAVATAKFVAPGAEALSLAIPVQTVCRVAVCAPAGP